MHRFSRCLGALAFLLGLALLLPGLTAQEKKDDKKDVAAKKDEAKKDDAKKDDAKKTAKKDGDDKKDAKSKKTEKKPPADDNLVYDKNKIETAKIAKFDPEGLKEFTVTFADPKKAIEFKLWQANTLTGIAQDKNAGSAAQRYVNYLADLPGKQSAVYTAKETELKPAENMRVRMLFLPQEFDDNGKPKAYTKKEIAALRGSGKLPGYASSVEYMRPGQLVDLYYAKTAQTAKKKGINLDTKADEDSRPIIVMVLIKTEK